MTWTVFAILAMFLLLSMFFLQSLPFSSSSSSLSSMSYLSFLPFLPFFHPPSSCCPSRSSCPPYIFCFQVQCMSPACFSSSSDQSSFEKRLISSNKDYHFTCLTKIAITFQTFEKDNTSSATATSRTFASEAVPSGCETWIN